MADGRAQHTYDAKTCEVNYQQRLPTSFAPHRLRADGGLYWASEHATWPTGNMSPVEKHDDPTANGHARVVAGMLIGRTLDLRTRRAKELNLRLARYDNAFTSSVAKVRIVQLSFNNCVLMLVCGNAVVPRGALFSRTCARLAVCSDLFHFDSRYFLTTLGTKLL